MNPYHIMRQGGENNEYREQIRKKYYFNEKQATMSVLPVRAGWLRTISKWQKKLRDGALKDLDIPVLVLFSKEDTVLNPKDMFELSFKIFENLIVKTFDKGCHDILVSQEDKIVQDAIEYMEDWINFYF